MTNPNLSLHSATANDLDRLAQMNKQLIEDEKSANPMNLAQLRERMKRFLEMDYHAVLFEYLEVVGYALYRCEDDTFRERQLVYVRQFFIAQSCRRRGLGREAFTQLRQAYFEDRQARLEALTSNPSGLAFWQSLGFEPYAVTLASK